MFVYFEIIFPQNPGKDVSIPTNKTLISSCQNFFEVEEPFSLPKDEFEKKWKGVNNVWVQFGNTKVLKKDPEGWTKTYYCRFKKQRDMYPRISSSKESQPPSEKKRRTSKHNTNLCKAQITITCKHNVVTVRKTHLDDPIHTHILMQVTSIRFQVQLSNTLKLKLPKAIVLLLSVKQLNKNSKMMRWALGSYN